MSGLYLARITSLVALSFLVMILLRVAPSFSAQTITSRHATKLSVAERFSLRCGAWDTTGEQRPAVSIIAQCQAFLDATTINAVIEWPSARPPIPLSEWPERRSVTEWLKQQFQPTTGYRDGHDYCVRNVSQTSLYSLGMCILPRDSNSPTSSASLFYVTLYCYLQIDDAELALQCSPHGLTDQTPASDPALIVRKVDAFATHEHAIPPTIATETRFDPVFCDGIFQLVHKLGTGEKS